MVDWPFSCTGPSLTMTRSLSVSIWTVAGVHYTLEFWLQNQDLQTRLNAFAVSWNGTVVESFTNVAPGYGLPFIKHTYDVVGIGGPVDLSFFGEGTAWGLDDISLTAVDTVTPGADRSNIRYVRPRCRRADGSVRNKP